MCCIDIILLQLHLIMIDWLKEILLLLLLMISITDLIKHLTSSIQFWHISYATDMNHVDSP